MEPFKVHFLLNMGIFHCYVSLPEGTNSFWSDLQMPLWYGCLLAVQKANKQWHQWHVYGFALQSLQQRDERQPAV